MRKMEKKEGISRRGFLKTAAAVGATFAVSPALGKVQAAVHAEQANTASVGNAKAAAVPHIVF